MADKSITQTIKDAEIDARSLSEFIYKPASFTVNRRLAPPIHTLDYYISTVASITNKVVAESGAFNTAIATANSKLDKAVTDAISKVSYIEQTVQDAIDNTAIEGGVLADTFVTVTASGEGQVARSQRDKNHDIKSFLDFHNQDRGNDYTETLRDAINSGFSIYVPDGLYPVRCVAMQSNKDFIKLYSYGNATFDIKGKGIHVVELTNQKEVVLDGIRFVRDSNEGDSLGWCRFLGATTTAKLGSITVKSCYFYNLASLCFLKGSMTQDPISNPYGADRLIVKNNHFQDIYHHAVQIQDFPISYFEVSGNEFYNSKVIGVSQATSNAHSFADKITELNRNTVVENNLFLNDDKTFARAGSYHCAVLVECDSMTYKNNHVEGFKSTFEDSVVYDVYVGARLLQHTGNTFKNNAALHPNASYKACIKAKGGPGSAGTPAKKIITNNTYIVDKDWSDKHSPNEKVSHYLYQLEDGGLVDAVVKGNEFNLYGFRHTYDGAFVNLDFSDNSINADFYHGESPSPCFLSPTPAVTDEGVSKTLRVCGNKWKIGEIDSGLTTISFLQPYTSPVDPSRYWSDVVVTGNSVLILTSSNINHPGNNVISNIEAKKITFKDNSINGFTVRAILRFNIAPLLNLSFNTDDMFALLKTGSSNLIPLLKTGSKVVISGRFISNKESSAIRIPLNAEEAGVIDGVDRTISITNTAQGRGNDFFDADNRCSLHLIYKDNTYYARFSEFFVNSDGGGGARIRKEVALSEGMADATYDIAQLKNGVYTKSGVLEIKSGIAEFYTERIFSVPVNQTISIEFS